MRFCTFSTFAQKIYKRSGWNFTWSFRKVLCTYSTKMVFVARIIRPKLCIIYALFYFFQKSFLNKDYFLIAAILIPVVHGILVLFFFEEKQWRGNAEKMSRPVIILYLRICFSHEHKLVNKNSKTKSNKKIVGRKYLSNDLLSNC